MSKLISISVLLAAFTGAAQAASDYQTGCISNVTFVGDEVLIMVDSGLPTNCAGTRYGWIMVPASSRITKAFVLGLWMRGDAAQTSVTVYTSGINASGYCQANQIDPVG